MPLGPLQTIVGPIWKHLNFLQKKVPLCNKKIDSNFEFDRTSTRGRDLSHQFRKWPAHKCLAHKWPANTKLKNNKNKISDGIFFSNFFFSRPDLFCLPPMQNSVEIHCIMVFRHFYGYHLVHCCQRSLFLGRTSWKFKKGFISRHGNIFWLTLQEI